MTNHERRYRIYELLREAIEEFRLGQQPGADRAVAEERAVWRTVDAAGYLGELYPDAIGVGIASGSGFQIVKVDGAETAPMRKDREPKLRKKSKPYPQRKCKTCGGDFRPRGACHRVEQ